MYVGGARIPAIESTMAAEMWKDPDTEFSSQRGGVLAEDNKRLQEMLHAALRREAEALRRVKHLSELLSACRVNCGTPSSGPERRFLLLCRVLVCIASMCVVADGVTMDGRKLDWEVRPAWETAVTWDESDTGSAPHSQVMSLLHL